MVHALYTKKEIPLNEVRLFLPAIVASVLIVLAISSSPAIYSQGTASPTGSTLSKDEQELWNEINQARAHPDVYASYLEKLKPLFAGKVYKGTLETQEGWAAVEDAIAFLRTLKPQSPFTMSQGLCKAAAAHMRDQGSSGTTGHKSTGSGLMIEDRLKPFGTWQGGIGENLSYGNDSARERVLTWLIDDGFATRGHRKRVMSADYRVAGLSCGKHPQYEKMCVLTLAGGFTDAVAVKSVETPTPVNESPPNHPESDRGITNSNSSSAKTNPDPKTTKTGTTVKSPKR